MFLYSLVATVFTVYGIETFELIDTIYHHFGVATVLTVYGIETILTIDDVDIRRCSCNSTYRLRY